MVGLGLVCLLVACGSSSGDNGPFTPSGGGGPSGGSGGPSGDTSGQFESTAGIDGEYRLYVPSTAPGGVYGLVAWFHPDDADPWDAWHENSAFRDFAEREGLVWLSMRAPGQEVCWWTPHNQLRAAYVHEFIDSQVMARYNVDRDRVYFAGMSGGSYWMNGFPFHQNFPYRGGMISMCGGDIPRLDNATNYCAPENIDAEIVELPSPVPDSIPASAISGIRYYFAVGDADGSLVDVQAAQAFYAGLGFTTEVETIAGAGHCDFSDEEYFFRGYEAVTQ